jgi:hypothetical protein
MKRFKIRDRATGKYLGVIRFSIRGKLIKPGDLMKALNFLKKLQGQFDWDNIDVVEYRLIEISTVPIREFFLEKLI